MKSHKKILIILGLALIMISFVFIFMIQPIQITGDSMEPTYQEGELHFILKSGTLFNSRSHEYKVGEVVLVQIKDEVVLRRIIALPGSHVSIEKAKIIIDGITIDESDYLSTHTTEYLKKATSSETLERLHLSKNKYLVLPDNRKSISNLKESGVIDASNILGILL